MSSNNTYDTKCDMTPACSSNIKFLMEPMSILASLGLNLVWFTSISKLTNESHPNYDQGCRLGELLRVGEGGGPLRDEELLRLIHLGSRGLFGSGPPFLLGTEEPTRLSLGNPSIQPPGPPWLSAVSDGQ